MKHFIFSLLIYFSLSVAYADDHTGCVHFYLGEIADNQMPYYTVCGLHVGSLFGLSIASAGDFNNDGYDDVIIGAPGTNYANWNAAGAIYILLGGEEFNSDADRVIYGTRAGVYFGQSVACAGDFNGDGYSDAIAGGAQTRIILGNSNMDSIRCFNLHYRAVVVENTIAVSSAGDFNNDGFDDVVVGDRAGNDGAGIIYLYFGGDPMDDEPDVVINGSSDYYRLGSSVASGGKINDDEYDDIIVGIPEQHIYYPHYYGKAMVYFGGSSPDAFPDFGIIENDYPGIGEAIRGAGDINGDGYDDVVVGRPEYGNMGCGSRVYVYYGGENVDTIPDLTLSKDNFGFGNDVDIADMNHDKYDDLLISNCEMFDQGGLAYIWFGSVTPQESYEIVLPDPFEGRSEEQGKIAEAGDLNADGHIDLMISEPYMFSVHHIRVDGLYDLPPEQTGMISYPNPFNSSVMIAYNLPEPDEVLIRIFNSSGQEIETTCNEFQEAGSHELTWVPVKLTAGLYFCRIETEKSNNTIKLTYLK